MNWGQILRPVFVFLFIVIIYLIIFLALRIMYKDVKSGDKKKILKKSLGLEILAVGENSGLKKGSIIPIHRLITMGRREDNTVVLSDPYASGHHAKIFIKNTDYYLEDLNSTNGTLLNDERVEDRVPIEPGDEIRIGSTVFKVIG
ncbi:MAG: FHA domain-containing protein [Bacillota bacterium]|nr:FHA domain-containing protein [Bacillota bacterium]